MLSAEGIPHAFCQRCLIRAPAYHPGQAGAKDKAFWTLYILWNFMDLVQARPSLTRKTKIYLFFLRVNTEEEPSAGDKGEPQNPHDACAYFMLPLQKLQD